MKNKFNKEKLEISLVNTRNMKSAVVYFPVITPTRRKYFDSLEYKKGDEFIILGADFHIREVNEMLLRNCINIDLNELNYWATIYYNECEEAARKMFDALVESGYIKINCVKDLLTILANLNCYYYIDNVKNCKEVALFRMKLQCFLGKPIDYKSLPDYLLCEAGEAIKTQEKGIFYKNRYIGFYGKPKPQRDSPEIYEIPKGLKLV